MCFHMLNPCWSNTKRFLSVLVIFGKSFVFTKMSKFSKTVLPCFGNSIASWSSHMSQSQAHTLIFCGSLAGHCPSREKYLEYFSKFGFLMFLATQSGDLFVSGRSSHEGYTKIFAASLMTYSWVELPVAKNTWKIFQNLSLRCFVAYPGDLLVT